MPSIKPQKIMVISLAGIGDTLLATPMIRELRLNFPEARIDALVLWAGSKDFLENNPHLNHVYQKNLLRDSKLDSVRFLNSLRKERYDVSVNIHPQSRIHYRVIARMIGAKVRISHTYECSGLLDNLLVNRTIPQDYSKHTVENNIALLSFLGVEKNKSELRLEVFLRPDEERWADEYMQQQGLAGEKCLGIHVGSGGTKNLMLKRWPLENYVQLIRKLNHDRADINILLFGGPEEREAHNTILKSADAALVLQPETKNIRQAGALIKKCSAFLSVDTSLMHLAAAVRVPRQIVIETPTFNKTLYPFAQDYVLVPNPVVGGRNLEYYLFDGQGIKGAREELIQCMNSVTVDAVFGAVCRMI
jgi:ADP-heptose:LPS heptosyltransferase